MVTSKQKALAEAKALAVTTKTLHTLWVDRHDERGPTFVVGRTMPPEPTPYFAIYADGRVARFGDLPDNL